MLVPVVAAAAILALWGVARGMRQIEMQPRKVASRPPAWVPAPTASYDALLRAVRGELARNLVGRIDWSRPIDDLRHDIRHVVGHLIDTAAPLLNRIEREELIAEVVAGVKPPRPGG